MSNFWWNFCLKCLWPKIVIGDILCEIIPKRCQLTNSISFRSTVSDFAFPDFWGLNIILSSVNLKRPPTYNKNKAYKNLFFYECKFYYNCAFFKSIKGVELLGGREVTLDLYAKKLNIFMNIRTTSGNINLDKNEFSLNKVAKQFF